MVGLFLLLIALGSGASAQAPANAQATPQETIAQANSDLRAASAGLNTRDLTDKDIQGRLAALPPIQSRLHDAVRSLAPRRQDIQARQAQLGAPPAPGAPPEDPRTAQTRHDLAKALESVTADIQQARLLALAADQTSATLSDRLRENVSARLWTQNRSVLDPGLWRDFALALPGDMVRLTDAAAEELDQADLGRRAWRDFAILGLVTGIGLFLMGPARLILNRVGYRRVARAPGQPRLRRILLALWLVAVAALTPLLAGLALRAGLREIEVMTPPVDRLTTLILQAVVFAAFLEGLGRAVLSPGRPQWRLAPLPNPMVRRLAPFPGLIGVTAALTAIVAGLASILGASLASRLATDCLALTAQLAVVGGGLMAVGRARVAQRALAAEGKSEPAVEGESRLPWIIATLGAWLAVTAAALALLAGYLALASFIMRETVWIAAILATLFLLLRLADDLFPALLSPRSPLGGALETALGLSEGSLEPAGVLLSGLTRLLLLLIAWVAMIAPFGASAEDIFHRFTATDFVVRLGLVSISPGAILGGLALFLAGIWVTRGVRRWLEVRYLPKTGLDVGLRTSLATGVTYIGAMMAILVAFAYLGLSVAQIALFASALSVGIGFGLQSIIGNFVSGLILLAERPVRVGDWIAIGDQEGDVRKINIRATEIELMDQSRLIVPNSELVSKAVRNVTHSGALGRIKIVVKLDPSADPAQARDLILARLRAHAQVLADPAPAVYLTDLKDAALEMTAFAFVPSPRLAYRIKSELLFQIVPDLKGAGIGMAAAGTVVHVDVGDRAGVPIPGEPP